MAFGSEMVAGAGFGLSLVMTIIGILLGALFLWISAKIFKLRDKSFKTPLIIAAIVGVVGFILGIIPIVNMFGWIVAIALAIWLIKTKYSVDWVKAILVWLVYFVLSIVAGMIVAFVIGGLFLGGMMA